MKYRFFTIPVREPAAAQEDLNRFLAAHRVAGIDKQFVADGPNSLWSFVVGYDDGETAPPPAAKGKIDYREVLSEADFAVFARLRVLRKELAERAGIPAFGIFTNEQLAELVRQRVTTAEVLEGINGVGKARAEKYGAAFLALLAESFKDAAPPEGP